MNKQKGFSLILVIILVMVVAISFTASISFLTFIRTLTAANRSDSLQSYYLAESAVEDATLKITKEKAENWFLPENYTVSFKEGEVDVEIDSHGVTNRKTIATRSDVSERVKKVKAEYTIGSGSAFHYGVQVGTGGILMDNNTKIIGNVSSSGNIESGSPQSNIEGSVELSGTGNKISGIANVSGSVYGDICEDTNIEGELHYISTNDGCSAAGGVYFLEEEIEEKPFPISEEQIEEWRAQAEDAEVFTGDYEVESDEILGPIKIDGNLEIPNVRVFVGGPVWVTGDIDIATSPQDRAIRVIDEIYGGVGIVADGQIDVGARRIMTGSGEPGSYLALVSTLDSSIEGDKAIFIRGNADVDIIHAPYGIINIGNNSDLKVVTAWQLEIENQAEVTYEEGLASAFFYSGPGGAWKVMDWKEVE